MSEFKKLTAEEILQIVEDASISVSDFAYEGVSDLDLFSDYTDEQKIHVQFYKDHGWNAWKDYAEKHKLPESFYSFVEECYKAAGSPKIIGEWEEVASGGGMDKGSDWYSVKYFKDHDVYIRTDGYYQSHHGTDFHDGYGYEVFPQQKTITVYQ